MIFLRVIGALVLIVVALGQNSIPPPEPIRFESRAVGWPESGPISLIDLQHIWVGLTYSEDGGATWVGRFPPADTHEFERNIPPNFQKAAFVNSRRGWLSVLGRVWVTNDAGTTWSPLFDGTIRGFDFSGNTGWMAIDKYHSVDRSIETYVTRDQGATWSKCGSSWKIPGVAPFSLTLIDEHTGWGNIAKFDARGRAEGDGVARTDDGGCTWEILWWDPMQGDQLFGIQFVDKSTGWMGASRGRLLETHDGGLNWRTVPLPRTDFYLEGVHLMDRKKGWVLGNPMPNIYFTLNGGVSWKAITESDLRENRGATRDIPSSWGEGLLTKIRAAHSK
jgi:photosystem II stability/assembly factor-like uncharacterized protein